MGKFDEIFDDVVVNAKAAASAVSKKASGVYDASKQKITAAELRSTIAKKLRELGAVIYKTKTGVIEEDDEVVTQLVNEIKELKDNLDTITENLASKNNRKKCASCGSTVPKNSLFCNICGAKLSEEDEEVKSDDSAEECEASNKNTSVDTIAPIDDFSEISSEDE